MFKDQLDTSIFTRTDGKNYRLPKKLSLEEVKTFLEEAGYKVSFLEQQYRHVHGLVLKDKKKFFLKLATTKDISERNYNEYIWNTKVGEIIEETNFKYLTVPKIWEYGYFEEDLFYYLSEFYENNFVSTKYPMNKLGIESQLYIIAKISVFLTQIQPSFILPRDAVELGKHDQRNLYLLFYDQDLKLIQHLQELNLDNILEMEISLRDNYNPSLAHGDYVPWHLFVNTTENLVLIDSEQGSTKLPRYFDIVYMFTRIYGRLNDPILAKKFLHICRDMLPTCLQKNFYEELKPLIASRVIDSFWHAKNENMSYELVSQLRRELEEMTISKF